MRTEAFLPIAPSPMRHSLLTTILTAAIAASCIQNSPGPDYAQYVNPLVGTDFHGHTFPGASYPFGMVQLSPDTREDNWDGCSGYHYSDSTVWGFSHTHLSGTGCADLCDVLVSPVTGFEATDSISVEACLSEFSHSSETASPGYYSVMLDRWGIKAEMTVGERLGMHRYTYPEGQAPQIVVNLEPRDYVVESSIVRSGRNSISGVRISNSWAQDQRVFFDLAFSLPIESIDINDDERGANALLTFAAPEAGGRAVLVVRAGISSVSEENARRNALGERRNFDFDAQVAVAREAWNAFLSKIEVETGDLKLKRPFYTALYHTAIHPSLYSDSNGEYMGEDHQTHKAEGFDRYSVFSLWDTFRAAHPLFNIIEQKRTEDFLQSFLSVYDEYGELPMWELDGTETHCMIGYNAIPVIADAAAKGIGGFDADRMLEAMLATTNRPDLGIQIYRDNGLVLAEKEHESVSKTLEYAVGDWCVARATELLRDRLTDKNLADSVISAYTVRSQFYRNIFDPQTGFSRPRVRGIFVEPFDPREVNVHFTEANSWQYSFHVQHDIEGLISLHGGDEAFGKRLDGLFSASSELSGWQAADVTGMVGQYSQGNEPSHHVAYLYDFIGQPWKTQEVTRRIMDTYFHDGPDGLCGNEDCGQMSAWYVLSALGFYPVTPASNQYAIGSPIFDKAVIHLENGTDFTISKEGSGAYIASAMRDGEPCNRSYITWDDIESGSGFVFRMADEPGKEFGIAPEDRPSSRVETTIVENPWFVVDNPVFEGSTELGICALNPQYSIMYTIDGGEPEAYSGPVHIDRNCTVSAWCETQDGRRSFPTVTRLTRIVSTSSIDIHSRYSRQYTAGGDKGLIDGIRGELNFRLGGWQGYQDTDFEAVVDLKKVQPLASASAGFLQDAKSWIWMPQWAEFSLSTDGVRWSAPVRASNGVAPEDMTIQMQDLGVSFPEGTEARYIKVFAKNLGIIPDWHPGAGSPAFIFIDEICVDI